MERDVCVDGKLSGVYGKKPLASEINMWLSINNELNVFFCLERLTKEDFTGNFFDNEYRYAILRIACAGYIAIIERINAMNLVYNLDEKLVIVKSVYNIYNEYKIYTGRKKEICIKALQALIDLDYVAWFALYNICVHLSIDKQGVDKDLFALLGKTKKADVIEFEVGDIVLFSIKTTEDGIFAREMLKVFLHEDRICQILLQEMHKKYKLYFSNDLTTEDKNSCVAEMIGMIFIEPKTWTALSYMLKFMYKGEDEKKAELLALLGKKQSIEMNEACINAVMWSALEVNVPHELFYDFTAEATADELRVVNDFNETILHNFLLDQVLDAYCPKWGFCSVYKNGFSSILFQICILGDTDIFEIVDCMGQRALDVAIIALAKHKQARIDCSAIEKCIYAIGLLIGFGAKSDIFLPQTQKALRDIRLSKNELDSFANIYADGSPFKDLVMKFVTEKFSIEKEEHIVKAVTFRKVSSYREKMHVYGEGSLESVIPIEKRLTTGGPGN